MHPRANAETMQAHGCTVVLRRVEGPEALELFLGCQPPAGVTDAGRQAEAIYRAIADVLEAEGGSFGSVVSETLFLRSLRADLEPVRTARQRALSASAGGASSRRSAHRPATTEIEQPPLNGQSRLEVAVQAILPRATPLRFDEIASSPACTCAECARSHGLRVHLGEEERLYASGLHGSGESAYAQTLGMFIAAENLLKRAGMAFGDVVRTWIHLRDIDRDYEALNRARREFFATRGIDPPPASTGIGGGTAFETHPLCLGLYAVRSARRPPARTVMTAPTLNEAPQYGADFVRGVRMVETNKIALHVSGTASIDEAGRTAHPGDFDAQADRMLANVASLLDGQGATFADVVSAVSYLKHPGDARRLRDKLHEAGFTGFPHVLVAAPVCRPELLCETEALAVLARTDLDLELN